MLVGENEELKGILEEALQEYDEHGYEREVCSVKYRHQNGTTKCSEQNRKE